MEVCMRAARAMDADVVSSLGNTALEGCCISLAVRRLSSVHHGIDSFIPAETFNKDRTEKNFWGGRSQR
jgi:hypothetical protein